MKQLGIKTVDDKTPTEFVKKAEQKKQQKHIGSIRLRRGLTLFQMNTETGKISKVSFDETHVNPDFNKGKVNVRHKVTYNPKMLYVQALNMKNAKKKFEKIAKQIIDEANSNRI